MIGIAADSVNSSVWDGKNKVQHWFEKNLSSIRVNLIKHGYI